MGIATEISLVARTRIAEPTTRSLMPDCPVGHIRGRTRAMSLVCSRQGMPGFSFGSDVRRSSNALLIEAAILESRCKASVQWDQSRVSGHSRYGFHILHISYVVLVGST